MTDKYSASHPEALLDAQNKLAQHVKITEALQALNGGAAGSKAEPNTEIRTVASPDWQGQPPHNVNMNLGLPGVPIADFEANHRRACEVARV